jgi:hypothetical protein
MRKLLFGAVATAIVALQPTLALAQRVPSDFIKVPTGATNPSTLTRNATILQTIPVSATSAGLPSGVLGTARCIVGTATGVTQGTFEHIRFVGNILCLDPGSDGQFRSFAGNCPTDTDVVIQGVKLIKVVPRIPKCPDVYPGATYVQTGTNDPRAPVPGIRTWFPLKHSPPGTTFTLEVEYACVNRPPARGIREVRLNRFIFTLAITPDTLSWVVHALHNEPLGVCEVPCITDEGLFDLLLRQSDAIRNAAAGGAATIRALNTALDVMEATIVARCGFVLSAWHQRADGTIIPCSLFLGELPGNFTIGRYGFGIYDTIENPCCCKLIADLYDLKLRLIGNDP